jgi:dienelactone hydrolase
MTRTPFEAFCYNFKNSEGGIMKYISIMLMALSFSAFAKVKTENIEYMSNGVKLKGVIAFDDAKKKPVPGVLVFSNWMGNGQQNIDQAKEIASRGFVALAADIYGEGLIPKDQKEASELAGKYRNTDRTQMRERAMAGFTALQNHKRVEKSKIAAIGFCFGGTVALEMARAGADLKGVVSFHGGLSSIEKAKADTVKAKVLALHGADDFFVPEKEVLGFEQEMKDAKADWQLFAFSNSVHSFTDKDAGNDPKSGQAYNPLTSKRAFKAMDDFFAEIF